MTQPNQVLGLPASFDAYIRHGWSLVPMPSGTKGPTAAGWNRKENCLRDSTHLPPGHNVGLAHAYSGTMALDIDDWDTSVDELARHGISLQQLYDAHDAVTIISGNPGHGKLLYAMPFGLALPSKKITTPFNGVKKVTYELRCATTNDLTVQDVLPPSIHPNGRPYQWGGKGRWEQLPIIPQALLDLWQSMLAADAERNIKVAGSVDASWDDIRSALAAISPDVSREEWVQVGMALHHAGHHTEQLDQALQLFDEWSSYSQTKYKGQQDVLTQWRSFKPDNGITLGTLFHTASGYGWKRPVPDASTLFKNITPENPRTVKDHLRPSIPTLDMSLFPSVLATRAEQVGVMAGCDPLVALFAGLGAACGAIDARTRLELLPGFKVPPILWMMTIGAPGDKKSPGSKPMVTELRAMEQEDRPRFAQEMLGWEGQEAAYASAKKAFLEQAANPETMMSNTLLPSVPVLPPQPNPLRLVVGDITSQKLVHHCVARPEGSLCFLDEMGSWVKKLTDKTSGEDRSCWVVAYEGDTYTMDRVGTGTLYCDNMAISIYGNIQPKVLRDSLVHLTNDGLLQRFIPVILDPDMTRKPQSIPAFLNNEQQWGMQLRQLRALPANTYRLSFESTVIFDQFQDWYNEARRDERLIGSNDTYMTAFSKLEGLCGRVALVMHLMNHPFSLEVPAATMHKAVEFIKSYVVPVYRYTLGEVGGFDDESIDRWVMEHIIQISGESSSITLREIKRSARRQIEGMRNDHAEAALRDAMALLEQKGWLTVLEENRKSIVWAIHPQLSDIDKHYRTEVVKAKQRIYDRNREIVLKSGRHTERRLARGFDPDTMDE
jgi:hypothetical protein